MDVTKEVLLEIINAGIRAPSGDNSQPWRFEIEKDVLELYNIPDRDNPFYNFKQRGSLVAHGALIENMTTTASHSGYEMRAELHANELKDNLVARITFHRSEPKSELLYPSIFKRATNRKPYNSKIALTAEQKTMLTESVKNIPDINFTLTESSEDKKEIGTAVSTNEIVALETEKLHNIFFSDIVWTEKEEKEKRKGLYIKTLELPPPIQLLFRGLKHWKFNNALNKIGFAKGAAKGNAQIYSSGSAIGIITIKERTGNNFVNAGRAMERLWLASEYLGLSFQPIAGMLFLAQRIDENEADSFNTGHQAIISDAYKKIENIFSTKGKTISMLFRIGHAEKPSAYSSRLAPIIKYT
ncbi:MAG: hypothetical protein Q8Q06_01320 [bacterium]|nr:hypothetical protein [bacterium]